MRHGEKCVAVPDRRQRPQHGGGQRRDAAQPGRIVAERAERGARRQSSLRHRDETGRPRAHPARAGTGGAMAAASRTAAEPGPSRPAGSRRTPASVAGRGAAASAATDGSGRRKRRAGDRLQQRRERAAARAARRDSTAKPFRPQRRHVPPGPAATVRVPLGPLPADAAAAATSARGRRARRRRGRGAAGAAAAAAPSDRHSRVLDPGHAGGSQRRAQPCRRDRQQRTQDAQPAAVSTSGAMPAMPAGPLPPSARISTRLRLVARVVAEQQMQDARRRAGGVQHGEPGGARPLGQRRAPRQTRRSSAAWPQCRSAPSRATVCRRLAAGLRAATRGRRPAPAVSRRAPAPSASASSASAMLSAPPDTPAARRGAGSNGPSRPWPRQTAAANVRRQSRRIAPVTGHRLADRSPAAGALRRAGDGIAHIGPRAGIFGAQLRQRVAGGLLLVDRDQRIGQPQQRVLGVRALSCARL